MKNCIGFIDVNGVSLPNKEVTCNDGTSSLEPNNPCTLKSSARGMGDIFPVVFHNGTVEPATNASKAFFSGEKSDLVSNSVSVETTDSPKSVTLNGVTWTLMNGSYYRLADAGENVKGTQGGTGGGIASDGDLVHSAGELLVKNSDGNYEYTPSSNSAPTYVYDKDLNTLGMTDIGQWYDYKNGTGYVREVNGNYVNRSGATYTKRSDGLYEYNGYVYDENLIMIGPK